MIQLPEHTHPRDVHELKQHLAMEERWSPVRMLFFVILFLLLLVGSALAGLLYREWL